MFARTFYLHTSRRLCKLNSRTVSLFWGKCMTKIHMHESQLFTSSTKHVTSTVGLMGLVRPFIADTLLVRFLTGISTSAHAFCSWDTTACAYYCPYESFSCITGPTTVNVRVTGLTPGLHGFHLVSVVLLCNQLLISTPCFVRIMIHLFVLQHEFGDTTNGCISTGHNCPLILIMPTFVFCSYQILPAFCKSLLNFHPAIFIIQCYSGFLVDACALKTKQIKSSSWSSYEMLFCLLTD